MKKIKYILIGLATTFIITEILLRVVLGLGNPPIFEKSEHYGYRFKPSQDIYRFGKRIYFNSEGLRSEEINEKPAEGVMRILCIGDSITYGGWFTDQKDTYPYLLRDVLNRNSKYHFEAINASAPSWGIGNEEAYLRNYGIYNSQIVILQIMIDDLFGIKSNGDLIGESPNYPVKKPLLAIQEIFQRGFFKYKKHFIKNNEVQYPDNKDAILADSSGDGLESLRQLKPKINTETEINLFNNLVSISKIKGMVEKNNAELIVIMLEPCDEPKSHYDLNKFAKSMLEMTLSELNAAYVDLKKETSLCKEKDVFYDRIHPNSKGNKIIAEELADFILKK